MTVFETRRLTAAEVIEDDIAELLDVHLSTQAYLDMTEGSGGVAGAYDRGMLERDLSMSAMTPGRHTCTLRLREGGGCVGLLGWMDENPSDGAPRIGLVMIHANHQRRGLAAEAITGLAEHGRAAGWSRLREGVIAGNDAGMALALALGMREVERKPHRIAAAPRQTGPTAWITWRAGRFPAVVAFASPVRHPPSSRHSSWMDGPPAR